MSDEKDSAVILHRHATDVAGAVKDFVLQKSATSVIQGKRYLRVEAWMCIANGFGCVGSARDVKVVDGGVSAIGEVRRISDGTIMATAEGFVGDDEKTWAGRPMFARRAMAQTRAISRACRSAFAFVVPIIDAGLSTTPAEEMDYVDSPSVSSTAPKAFAQTLAKALPEPESKASEDPFPAIELPSTAPIGELEAQLDAYIAAKDFKKAAAVINQAANNKDKVRMAKKLQAAAQ